MKNTVCVQRRYKRNLNTAYLLVSLVLKKYTFSCWTPFQETFVTAHIVIYIYTAIPLFMRALNAGSVASVLTRTLIYRSLQFRFVGKSLEELSNMENSECHIEQIHANF
jgi:hypothetical protein